MSDSELRARADLRFQEALERTGARDPREFYRERLRELRGRDGDAYGRAVEHYETRLIPAVAAPDSDPLAEWLDYGRLLAQLSSPGRTVVIDDTGRASDFQPPVPLDRLVLHLPNAARDPVLPVGLPRTLSAAQRATFALLVQGRRE